MPYDREGRIHKVPWDQLLDGTYSTTQFKEGAFPGTAMPAWGDILTPQDIEDVIAFLRLKQEEAQ